MTMTVGSLFSGIGGMDLGLERSGFIVKWQVENDDYCTRVLAKHWPDVPRFGDIRDVGAADLTPVDLIAGGFPCQDVSNAGKRAGIDGERSGLWSEFARLVGELRPRYVLVENTTGLLGRGAGRVLGDLAAMGYDAEWSVVPACAFGAPHPRERVFIIAHAHSIGHSVGNPVFRHAISPGSQWEATQGKSEWQDMERWLRATVQNGDWRENAGEIRGVPDGLPRRVDRLRGLGNAVVPQVAQWIGEQILRYEEAS